MESLVKMKHSVPMLSRSKGRQDDTDTDADKDKEHRIQTRATSWSPISIINQSSKWAAAKDSLRKINECQKVNVKNVKNESRVGAKRIRKRRGATGADRRVAIATDDIYIRSHAWGKAQEQSYIYNRVP